MADPFSADDALSLVVYERLTAVVVGALVGQDFDEDTPPPLVGIGAMSSSPAGGKAGGLDRIELTIATEVSAEGRKDLSGLRAQVRAALDQWRAPNALGAQFGEMTWEGGDDSPSEDGTSWFGADRFAVFVQPV